MEAYEDQKATFRNNLKKINAAVMALDVLSDSYLTKLATLTNIADNLNNLMKNIDVKIAELASRSSNVRAGNADTKQLAEAMECNAIVTSLKTNWKNAYAAWQNKR